MTTFVKLLRSQPSLSSTGAARPDDIRAAETQLMLAFSAEYTDYLLAYGCASCQGHEFTGICPFPRLNVVDATLDERAYSPDVPSDWYLVEVTANDGITLWQRGDGAVFAAGPGYKATQAADSLAAYLTGALTEAGAGSSFMS